MSKATLTVTENPDGTLSLKAEYDPPIKAGQPLTEVQSLIHDATAFLAAQYAPEDMEEARVDGKVIYSNKG